MTRSISATELKATILSVLDDVAAGEVVEISKRGRTIARLVPATGPAGLRGRFVGVAATTSDEEGLFATGERWNAE